jgi:large-conductance mechanosensitive channel
MYREHVKNFWQGLLQFLKKYSVIGLAIGVIIAQASKDFVDAIVQGIFTPFIKIIVPAGFQDLTFYISGQAFHLGAIINSGLTFIIVMVFLYFIIKMILKNEELLEKN